MKKLSVRLSVVTMVCLTASPAVAQINRAIQDSLRKKYEIEQQKIEIEQQRADAETKRAEAAATAAASQQRQASRTRPTSAPQQIAEGDPLENTDAQKCTLGGGVTIRVSGSIRPSSTTRCQSPGQRAGKEDASSPE